MGRAVRNLADGRSKTAMAWLKRLWPLLLLAAGFALFVGLRLDRYVSFAALKEHRDLLLDLVARHRTAMAVGFVAVYTLCVTFSLPVSLVMTITAGFLFGQLLGSVLVIIGATAGATGVFLAARTAFGDSLCRRAGPWLKKMESGFKENAISYLMVLRLIPIFPFFAVNLVPAMLGMSLRDFVLATFIGIIPGSFVFTSVGVGLGSVFDAGEEFTASSVLTPRVMLALAGLACLALLPVVYKKLKRR
ncbi:MAG: TVP38/TMEM64 family protein [Alphaproteobacteria bacterium]|nr:TVP38/TMEM64 family protein [Alphaproteobacteria bacterium]